MKTTRAPGASTLQVLSMFDEALLKAEHDSDVGYLYNLIGGLSADSKFLLKFISIKRLESTYAHIVGDIFVNYNDQFSGKFSQFTDNETKSFSDIRTALQKFDLAILAEQMDVTPDKINVHPVLPISELGLYQFVVEVHEDSTLTIPELKDWKLTDANVLEAKPAE